MERKKCLVRVIYIRSFEVPALVDLVNNIVELSPFFDVQLLNLGSQYLPFLIVRCAMQLSSELLSCWIHWSDPLDQIDGVKG